MALTGAQLNGRPLISLCDFLIPAAAATYTAIAATRNTNYGTPVYGIVYIVIGPSSGAGGTAFTLNIGEVTTSDSLLGSTAVGVVGPSTDLVLPILHTKTNVWPPGQLFNVVVTTATGFAGTQTVRCQFWGFVA